MWSKWGEQILMSGEGARERLAGALEQTGDMLTERATAHVAASKQRETDDETQKKYEESIKFLEKEEDSSSNSNNKLEIGIIMPGWSSIMEAAVNVVEKTKNNAMEKREKIKEILKPGPYKREKSLPLDVVSLKDAELVYVTDRIIAMGHPAMQSNSDGDITSFRKLAAVGHLLENRHSGKFMVWNLSEVEYDTSILENQVLTFHFPGGPAPPLGLMLKLLLSIESWLKADPENVAIVHCLTGRGRTATVISAFLCWTGEAGFHDPGSALEYIAKCKGYEVDALTIPSQRRYAMYFSNMFEGVRPNQPPLLLKRVILSEAPKFGRSSHSKSGEEEYGCCPYLQIFKAGHLVFTTTATTSLVDPSDELTGVPFCGISDGPIGFPLDVVVQGDILIRCRHLSRKGQRVSMFRAAFHTGYLPPKVLRLPKEQLDGACLDRRFPDDFFVDLIFETCDATMASKHLVEKSGDDPDITSDSSTQTKNEAVNRRLRGTVTNSASANNSPDVAVSAYAYDSMLHRDSRFWDVIMKRREDHLNKADFDQSTILRGPTIGRRRDFANEESDNETSEEGDDISTRTKAQNDPSLAFSIDSSIDNTSAFMDFFVPPKPTTQSTASPPKRDELMEALMALDDEQPLSPNASNRTLSSVHQQDDNEVEEIVFDSNDSQPLLQNVLGEEDVSTTQINSETTYHEVPSNDNGDDDDFVKTEDGEILDFDEELEDLENFLTKSGK